MQAGDLSWVCHIHRSACSFFSTTIQTNLERWLRRVRGRIFWILFQKFHPCLVSVPLILSFQYWPAWFLLSPFHFFFFLLTVSFFVGLFAKMHDAHHPPGALFHLFLHAHGEWYHTRWVGGVQWTATCLFLETLCCYPRGEGGCAYTAVR